MENGTTTLSFENPPLKEVSLLVHFDAIPGFHAGMPGLLWREMRSDYPSLEELQPIVVDVEKFGVPPRTPHREFQLLQAAPAPRILLVDTTGQWVIQFQPNLFAINWRRSDSTNTTYPRFEAMKRRFFYEYNRFIDFLKQNDLGNPKLTQVEMTYVNHIPVGTLMPSDVFNDAFSSNRYDSNLQLEVYASNAKHIIRKGVDPVGRIYTSIGRAHKPSDGTDVYKLEFLTRTLVKGSGVSEIDERFDLMRSYVNSCFEKITTPLMHEKWLKKGGAKDE